MTVEHHHFFRTLLFHFLGYDHTVILKHHSESHPYSNCTRTAQLFAYWKHMPDVLFLRVVYLVGFGITSTFFT